MDGYRASTYGDAFADVYDDWYGSPAGASTSGGSPPDATAAFLAARTDGPVLELGSGTGRLAGPLAARGLPVVGLDASTAMLTRSKASHPGVPVVAADMAEPPVRHASCGAVLLAFNTLFNLPSRALQRQALAGAASVLRPGGLVVVEAFVPGAAAAESSDRVDVVRLTSDVVVLRVSRTDASAGTVSGHHVELRDGAPVRLRPWQVSFCSPAELDRSASASGLALSERYGDWEGAPFGEHSDAHVSVYRRDEPHG